MNDATRGEGHGSRPGPKESAKKLADRQHFWETPKGFAAVVGALAVTIGALGGVLGYTIARAPQQQPMFPPGTVITIPPAATK